MRLPDSFVSPLDKLRTARHQQIKERDEVESELMAHRDDILKLPANSLNSLDVLLAVSEQAPGGGFVCDPKHFVNGLHKFLGTGDVAFESFQQAALVRSMVSQQAAIEVSKASSLSWLQVMSSRTKLCRDVVDMASNDLFVKLKTQHPYDEHITQHGRQISDCIKERALKVLEYQERSVDCTSDEHLNLLAQLHQETTALVAARDKAIQAWHKRTQSECMIVDLEFWLTEIQP